MNELHQQRPKRQNNITIRPAKDDLPDMEVRMFSIIQGDLDLVFQKVDKAFQLKAGHLSSFIPELALDPLENSLRPALLILSARLCGGGGGEVTVLGAVVQFIFTAQTIHNRIPDEGAKELPQFPVLIGDYLFSKYFQTLSENDLLRWLAPLAETICQMNEGGIRRQQILEKGQGLPADYLQVAREEEGLLISQACRIGGATANGAPETILALEQFGLNLGIAWGIVKGRFPLAADEYLLKARQALARIAASPERSVLLAVIERIGDINLNPGNYISDCYPPK